jgi:hypothetical protein
MTRLVFLVAALCLAAGCKENPVGRPCFIPQSDDGATFSNNRVSSPSVECQSKICVHIAEKEEDYCSGECESDEDCDTEEGSTCAGGFICMVPTTTGNFCCQKLCVCADYVDIPAGGVMPDLPQCDPADSRNECCNLPGRETTEQCRNRT